MNILVTGGAGFIGSHVVEAYLNANHNVVVLDNLSKGSYENLEHCMDDSRMFFMRGDVGDDKLVSHLISKYKIDVVNHHAAQTSVTRSMAQPYEDVRENVLNLVGLLETATRSGKVKRFIFSSSGGTFYGNTKAGKENDRPAPDSIYGISKMAGELYVKNMFTTWDKHFVVMRYANVYGPRQRGDGEAGVVAIFTEKMLKHKPVTIFGDGKAVRDYVFVEDVARANVIALNRFGIFNVGTGVGTSVQKIFGLLSKEIGGKQKALNKAARPGELSKSILDTKYAAQWMTWRAQTPIIEGIRKTVDWYRRRGM